MTTNQPPIPPAARPGGEGTPLLPCPFCGGEPYATRTVNGSQMYLVGCAACGIEFKAAWYRGDEKPTRDVDAAWNRRSPAPASGAPDEEAWKSAALRWQKRAEELERLLEEARVASNSFATRLAASERAVVALREEWTADDAKAIRDAHSALSFILVAVPMPSYRVEAFERLTDRLEEIAARMEHPLRAALTPTAPSPEERADG